MSWTVRPLDASTWDAFAELVERNGGIFGGCWCIGFHPERGQWDIARTVKEDRVRSDRAHAWCSTATAPYRGGISEVTTGREAPGRFLFSATVELFEEHGFTRVRQVGKHAWTVSRAVDAA
jgi:hypothetical protein